MFCYYTGEMEIVGGELADVRAIAVPLFENTAYCRCLNQGKKICEVSIDDTQVVSEDDVREFVDCAKKHEWIVNGTLNYFGDYEGRMKIADNEITEFSQAEVAIMDAEDDDLIQELANRGYTVAKSQPDTEAEPDHPAAAPDPEPVIDREHPCFRVCGIERYIQEIRARKLEYFTDNGDPERGLAVLEYPYIDLEVNMNSKGQLANGTPGDQTPVISYFCCIKDSEGEWYSEDYLEREPAVDWQSDDWATILKADMTSALKEYATQKGFSFDEPNRLAHVPVASATATEYYVHKKPISRWAEIRSDYTDDDGFVCIDAWKTGDDEEEGRVIAYVDIMSGRVIYADPLARVDKKAQEVIQPVSELHKKEHPYNVEDLESIVRAHVNYEAEEIECIGYEQAMDNLYACDMTTDQIYFFGFPEETEDKKDEGKE